MHSSHLARPFGIFLLLAALGLIPNAAPAQSLRLYTSPALGQMLAASLHALREAGIDASIRGEASSATAIQLLAEDKADAIFTVRPLSGEDRALAPDKAFFEVKIATQATALLVSRDVWESGVRALTKEQIRGVYEREITGWKQLGGLDRPIKFFNYTHGQGVWEHFAQWLYGEIRRAPLGSFDVVVSAEDARNSVEFNGGAMTIASPALSDGKEVFALALQTEAGAPVAPDRERILDRTYPIARPVLIVFADRPTGPRGRLRDFFLGPKGRDLITRRGLIPSEETAAP